METSRSVGAGTASTKANSSGVLAPGCMTKPRWGDSIRIVFLIRLAPPLYGGDTLCYQSCFPTTDDTISDLLKEKEEFPLRLV